MTRRRLHQNRSILSKQLQTIMLVVSKSASRPRPEFNPAGYRRARRQHRRGSSKLLIEMMKEAAIDSHVSGCLMGRKAGFKKSYSLSAYDDSSASQERLDFFRGVLQRIRLRDFLEEIHEARMYLYSVVDFEWTVDEQRQIPVSYKAFDQKYFRRDSKTKELKVDFGSELREIPKDVLVIEHKKDPIMLPVLRDYILKEFGLESWAAFIETFGEDFIFGKYPPGSDENFKDELEKGVNDLASSSRGIGPDGTDLEIHGSDRNTGDHQAFTERADTGISITLLGHANAVEDSGGVNVGGRQASFEVRHHVAVDDMYFIEPFVNELIRTVGERNFGDGKYPKFELNKAKQVNAKDHADIVDMAWRHRVKIHISEYEKLGLHVDTSEGEWVQKAKPTITLD